MAVTTQRPELNIASRDDDSASPARAWPVDGTRELERAVRDDSDTNKTEKVVAKQTEIIPFNETRKESTNSYRKEQPWRL